MSTNEDRYTLDLPRLIEAVADGEVPAEEITVRILAGFHPSLKNTAPEQLQRACREIRAAAAAKGCTVEELVAGAR